MKNLTLKVEGMHCKSCKMIIEDNLEELGVEKSDVSDESGEVKVTFDESKVNEEQIKKAIEKDGYKVK